MRAGGSPHTIALKHEIVLPAVTTSIPAVDAQQPRARICEIVVVSYRLRPAATQQQHISLQSTFHQTKANTNINLHLTLAERDRAVRLLMTFARNLTVHTRCCVSKHQRLCSNCFGVLIRFFACWLGLVYLNPWKGKFQCIWCMLYVRGNYTSAAVSMVLHKVIVNRCSISM